MPRSLRACLIVCAALSGLSAPIAAAQTPDFDPKIRLVAHDTPLAVVLGQLATQAGIDIVFADRTVAGRAVTGRYIGNDVEGALRTVLRDSGLRAEQVRPRQFVVVPQSRSSVGLPGPAPRGTLEGVVVDGATEEVLPGANVVLAGLGLGAATNTAGYFAIPGLPAGEYRVRISFIGYRTVEMDIPVYPASKLEQPVIRLFPQPLVSQSVVVEGAYDAGSAHEVTPGSAGVAIRDAGMLPSVLGDGDLFSAFEWLPGVTRAGEAGGELVVRGAEAQYNRYLLDGAPVIHPWHTFGLLSIFQPEALKTVGIHKGSYPAEHGGALSAVIDIEMRDGARGRASGMVAVSPVSIRGVAEAPLNDRVSLMLTARHSWLDLLLSPRLRLTSNGNLPSFTFDTALTGDQREDQDIGHSFYDLGAKITTRLAHGQRLSISLYEGGDRLDAEAPLTALGSGSDSDSTGVGLAYAWGNRVASARYHGLISDQLFLTGTAYYSAYRAREQSRRLPANDDTFETDYTLGFAEIGARADMDYYHSLEHQLRVGVAVVGRDFSSTLIEHLENPDDAIVRRDHIDRVRAVELIAYVQDTWQPSAVWQIQPGVRVEYFGLGGHLSINPRFHVRHALERDRLFLRAGLSRQTQPLHRLRDRTTQAYDLAADRWLPASDRVSPSSAWQVAVGLEWQPRPWLALEAEMFGRHLADILLPIQASGPRNDGTEPSTLLDRFAPGSGRGAGLELSAEAERGLWRGGVSYSLSITQERLPGFEFQPARYDAPHQVDAFLIGARGAWTVALSGTVRSGYPVNGPRRSESRSPRGQDFASVHALQPDDRLPVYARVDLSVGYSFNVLGLDWNAQAQAYNLLNRRNAIAADFPPASVTGEDVYGLPILPMVSLRARW